MSLLSIRLRYHTLKLRALCWVLARMLRSYRGRRREQQGGAALYANQTGGTCDHETKDPPPMPTLR